MEYRTDMKTSVITGLVRDLLEKVNEATQQPTASLVIEVSKESLQKDSDKVKQQYSDLIHEPDIVRDTIITILQLSDLDKSVLYSLPEEYNKATSIRLSYGIDSNPLLYSVIVKQVKPKSDNRVFKSDTSQDLLEEYNPKRHRTWNIKAHELFVTEMIRRAETVVSKAKESSDILLQKIKQENRVSETNVGLFAQLAGNGVLGKNSIENQAQLVACQEYKGDGYAEINSYLRGYSKNPSRFAKDAAEHMSSLLETSRTQIDLTVTRGMLFDSSRSPQLKKMVGAITKLQPGTIIQDKGFVSTTLNPEIANTFSDSSKKGSVSVVMQIDVPKGSKALPIGIASGRGYDLECEVLLQKDSKFVVERLEKKRNKREERSIYILHVKLLQDQQKETAASMKKDSIKKGSKPIQKPGGVRIARFVNTLNDLRALKIIKPKVKKD